MTLPRRTAILMSRLPRLIDPQSAWLRGLRAAMRRIHQRGETLVVAEGTAGFEVIRHGAQRLAVPMEIIGENQTATSSTESDDIPPRDRAVMAAAQTILVLGVRTSGNVHRGLRKILTAGGHVELVDLADMQSRSVREDLLSLGASLWSPSDDDQAPFPAQRESESRGQSDSIVEVVPFPASSDWSFLSHTTRACPGPWPRQSLDEYLDALWEGTDEADHSAIATLERIVTQRRLISSGQMIRGRYPAVCLTAVSLKDLPGLRQFRTHRTRWDFEPFGLCIQSQWLRDRGARPVIYGDESTWLSLPETDRPFFQSISASSNDGTASDGIDWSIEQEWRHVGDLDLRELSPDQAMLFVPRYSFATRLAEKSPWPITLWPDPELAGSDSCIPS